MKVDEVVDNLNRLAADERENFRKGIISRDPLSSKKAIIHLLEVFSSADLAARTSVTSNLNVYAKDKLVNYARAMAILAIRLESPPHILEGLAALAAEAGTGSDGRDSMIALMLLYHSATKLGMDVPVIFEQAASLAVNDFQRAIRSFPVRSPHKLDLAVWGMKEAMTADGFDYQLL